MLPFPSYSSPLSTCVCCRELSHTEGPAIALFHTAQLSEQDGAATFPSAELAGVPHPKTKAGSSRQKLAFPS